MRLARKFKRDKTVVIFGAGATKACGGPLTSEILPQSFRLRRPTKNPGTRLYKVLKTCLSHHFHVRARDLRATPTALIDPTKDKQFPALPLFMSLLDLAIDRDHEFRDTSGPTQSSHEHWNRAQLLQARNAVQYAIFRVLEHHLTAIGDRTERRFYREFLAALAAKTQQAPNIISLNYDIIVDSALFALGEGPRDDCEEKRPGAVPDYGCDIKVDATQTCTYGTLLKLHGSLNWLYCPACDRLDLAASAGCLRAVEAEVMKQLYRRSQLNDRLFAGRPCKECGVPVRPVLITPTHSKDYRNPHLSQIWHNAGRLLHQAERVYIVGYSLPEEDVDVTYLLRRGLADLDPRKITVVEYDAEKRGLEDHPVGLRYRSIFGRTVRWEAGGFQSWREWIK